MPTAQNIYVPEKCNDSRFASAADIGIGGRCLWWFNRHSDNRGTLVNNQSQPSGRHLIFCQGAECSIWFNYGGSTGWTIRRDAAFSNSGLSFGCNAANYPQVLPVLSMVSRCCWITSLLFQSSHSLTSDKQQVSMGLPSNRYQLQLIACYDRGQPQSQHPWFNCCPAQGHLHWQTNQLESVGGPNLKVYTYSRRPEEWHQWNFYRKYLVEFFAENVLEKEELGSIFNSSNNWSPERSGKNPGIYFLAPEVVSQCKVKSTTGSECFRASSPYKGPRAPFPMPTSATNWIQRFSKWWVPHHPQVICDC